MRIMVLGGRGFIGSHIVADLAGAGHDVVVPARRPADWRPLLAGVEVVVNAAGVLRGAALAEAHVAMPRAVYAAAAASGVARVVLISAISARPDVATDYARSKLAGEAVARESGLAWTILRPSLVYAEGSYGGTSLLRGLAALPWRVPLAGDGRFAFTPIHAADLARAVRIVCEDDRFTGQMLEPAGPETLSLADLLDRYRRWLGFGAARFVRVPMPAMRALARLGDLAGDGPISTTSLAQLTAGNAGDGAAFARAIGFSPRSPGTALRDRPAQVQDRWHARLYFLPAAIRAVLALTWLASGLLGLTRAGAATATLASALGLSAASGDALRIGASLVDIGVAGLVVADRDARWSTPVQLAVVGGYSVVLGAALPALWLDPLGALLKNLSVLALVLVHGAIANRR